MPDCPRCHQAVEPQAIACPHCRTPLKAYGHPGMPLHRAEGQEPLCATCTYDADDSCTYPKRPHAMDCILYHDRALPLVAPAPPKPTGSTALRLWIQRNLVWCVLIGLVLISLLLALLQ